MTKKKADIKLARQVAAFLRGEVIHPARYAVCDVGYPECHCETCRARWSASKVDYKNRRPPSASRSGRQLLDP